VADKAAGGALPGGGDPGTEALKDLILRAQGGDRKALAKVRQVADTALPDLWERVGNLADNAASTLLTCATGEDAFAKEAIERKMEALRKELSGPNPSPLERLTVERAVLCWLQGYYYDNIEARSRKEASRWPDLLSTQRQAETAQRRYLQALRTLAAIRRLSLPAVQVNVAAAGGQQMVLNGPPPEF
jgi:hypothetical protein